MWFLKFSISSVYSIDIKSCTYLYTPGGFTSGIRMSKQDVEKILHSVDRDKSNSLDFNEFCELYSEVWFTLCIHVHHFSIK